MKKTERKIDTEQVRKRESGREETERGREWECVEKVDQLSPAAEAWEWSTTFATKILFFCFSSTAAWKLIRNFLAKIRTWICEIKNSLFMSRLSISLPQLQLSSIILCTDRFCAKNGKIVGEWLKKLLLWCNRNLQDLKLSHQKCPWAFKRIIDVNLLR